MKHPHPEFAHPHSADASMSRTPSQCRRPPVSHGLSQPPPRPGVDPTSRIHTLHPNRRDLLAAAPSTVALISCTLARRSTASLLSRPLCLHYHLPISLAVLSPVHNKGRLGPLPLLLDSIERKDQKTLERLRAERKAKIDQLKERTNYYTTQQLIQRYDLNLAAKAAAATVLALKLGADSGLKVFLEDDSTVSSNMATGKNHDMEIVQSEGHKNRKPSHARSHNTEEHEAALQNQKVVEHYKRPNPNEGGWLARIVALLVGEDPTQCYALICGSCHMHNGLARKEDFPYITYYCPHCHALNGSQQAEGNALDSSSGKDTPGTYGDGSVFNNVSSLSGTPTASKLSPLQGLPEGVEEISGI